MGSWSRIQRAADEKHERCFQQQWLQRAAVGDPWPDSEYDAVLCGYGVFFFPDMDAGTRALIGMLRPGGRLALLTWATSAMADFTDVLVPVARQHHPHLGPSGGHRNAERIATPTALRHWLGSLGLSRVEVAYVRAEAPLTDELAWSLVVGTGFRGLLPPDREGWPAVRADLIVALHDHDVTSIRLDSLVATGLHLAPDR